ncbi:MAG: hypothetical protein OIN83_08345 [Candidatus Methanoperedens sp.]|nr:hypothetical protein [Candidatus Methanoperedens sp.]
MTLTDLCISLGTNFAKETNRRSGELTELIHFYSIILVFGSIAKYIVDRPAIIYMSRMLSYDQRYFIQLEQSSSAIVAGCLVGTLGIIFYILLYKNGYRNYIINGFLINATGTITLGILSFIFIMLKISNQTWLTNVILKTIVLAIAGILLFEIVNVYHEVKIKRFYHIISQIIHK